MYYFETRMHSRLVESIVLSLLVHILVFLIYQLTLKPLEIPQRLEPIKVKFVTAQVKSVPDHGVPINGRKSGRFEKLKTSKPLANHNSQAHSNLKKRQGDEHQNFKLMTPKLFRRPVVSEKSFIPLKNKTVVKPKTKTDEKTLIPLPLNKGLKITSNPQINTSVSVEENRRLPGSVYALLDGFDANPYAIDTDDSWDIDDSEVISLDTKKTLYSDYFARIKHQIERVWGYPEAAARNGISGQLTLRFQISKEGNLLKVIVTQASGAKILDTAAVKAVKMAAPYYPFPDTIKKEKLVIMATFIYSPSYDRIYHGQSYQ
ncbi:MAG: TonB family protein [Nitrospinota bacterium]|nr:TonB family protein [Nitrospinota bacterium]